MFVVTFGKAIGVDRLGSFDGRGRTGQGVKDSGVAVFILNLIALKYIATLELAALIVLGQF